MQKVLSLILALAWWCAVHVEALPKNKGNSNTGTGTNVAAAAAPSASGGITKATDGSTILDKTVQIKYAMPPLTHSPTSADKTAASQSATKSALQLTSSPPPLRSPAQQQE